MGSVHHGVAAAAEVARAGNGRSRWLRWDAFEGLLSAQPGSFHPHWHEEWSIGVVLRGHCDFTCRAMKYCARGGDVVVIPPRAVHAAGAGGSGFRMIMMYVPGELVSRRLGTLAAARDAGIWSSARTVRALSRAVSIHDTRALWRLFAQALEAVSESTGADPEPDPRIDSAREMLRGNVDRRADIEEIARRVDISREYLHRLFRSRLGLTPLDYERLVRMERARAILRTGAGIAEAAALCGFTDQAHFSRWFRRYYGVTPRAFALAVLSGSGLHLP